MTVYDTAPHPVRRRRAPQPIIQLDPHSFHLIGSCDAPILDLVFDCGAESPAYVIKMTRDLCVMLRERLNTKLTGAQHD